MVSIVFQHPVILVDHREAQADPLPAGSAITHADLVIAAIVLLFARRGQAGAAAAH